MALRSVLRLLALVLLLAAAAGLPSPARSQSGPGQPDEMQRAAQLAVLIKLSLDARDPSEAIRLATQALDLEATLKTWPLQARRDEVRGSLWNRIGQSYLTRGGATFADDMERAIAAYEQALRNVTRNDLPKLWSGLQNDLGIAYVQRVRGERADNIERAIGAYEAALGVATQERMPIDWARLQMNLANAYRERPAGDRAGNIEKGLTALQSALGVFTRERHPADWAKVQVNLGAVYFTRIRGERADNLERAIAALGAALTVYTREQHAAGWGAAQQNLGLAYYQRIGGDRADNLERAIAALEASLAVRTRERWPIDWAGTQTTLGIAYVARVNGDRADNIERAIAAHEAALTVYRLEQDPIAWARVTTNLGNALQTRLRGDRGDNIERSIAAYQAALKGFTRERIPYEWAKVHNNLGMAHVGRVRGSRLENLQTAAAAFEASLTVRTPEADPRDHLATARALGEVALESRDWAKASRAYAGARAAFALLFGQGLEETEARDLIAQAGPLFAQAAFAAAQQGDGETALELASEGKARLLGVALRLQGLELGAEKRARLEELRAAIRARSRAHDAATERTAALDQLAALRRELLALVQEADQRGAKAAGGVLAAAQRAVPEGGAIVVPIVTNVGGKLLIVTSTNGKADLAVVDRPELYSQRVTTLIRGTGAKVGLSGGWLGSFNIQYLPHEERLARFPEWLNAIARIGPDQWRLFAGRLDQALKERGVKPGARVVWLPSGALGLLPLALARESDDARSLGDTYELVTAPSLDVLTQAGQSIARKPALSLAAAVNPTGDLAFTELEGALVAAHFAGQPSTMLNQTKATAPAVLAALKGRSYWHFSSHGFFDWRDARKAGLKMNGDVPLTIGALLDEEGKLGRPRLVVLSACETGLYDIARNADEFVGLPATFMQLGAAGVVSTLWQVDDFGTALLVAKFYDLHLDGGLAPPTALKQAQAWLRQATSADVVAYMKTAGARAKLDETTLAAFLTEMTRGNRAGPARAVWAKARSEPTDQPTGQSAPETATAERPFAHPYYWGGFVYTGL